MYLHTFKILTLLIISSFLLLPNFSDAKVLISRIQISGVSTTDEFVELYNYSSSSVSISDWDIRKQTAGGSQSYLVSSFPTSAILNPFSYFLIGHRDYVKIAEVNADLQYSNNSTSLAADNSLLLFDAQNNLIDEVNWGAVSSTGSPAANPSTQKSLTRLPNNADGNYLDTDNSSADFVELDSLPRNSFSPARPVVETSSPTPTTSDTGSDPIPPVAWNEIKINEILPDPIDGDEWIELFNTGSSNLDLTGVTLCDSRTSESCTIASPTGTILAGGWRTIYLSGSRLNNDGDSVLLKNLSGETIDRAEYGSGRLPRDGQSLARVSDGIDTDNDGDWAISDTPTPNTANVITLPQTPPSPPAIGSGSGASDYFSALLQTKTGSSSTSAKGGSASGGKKTAKETITISWNINYPARISQNSSTIFDARRSADPRGGELLFTWDFGDGTVAEGGLVSHTFASSGIFTVTARATSTQGTTGQKIFTVKSGPGESSIFLKEILVRPDQDEDEVVTIGTMATNTTELGGWKIGTASDRWFTIPAGTLLRPDGVLRFFKSATHLSLVDGGGSVLLANPSGIVVDIIDYGKVKKGEVISDEPITVNTTTIAKPISNYSFLPIESAINQPVGTLTTVAGTVQSLPGEPFLNYFYLRDGESAIQIYSYKKDFPKLALGDRVRVYGEISRANGQPRLKTKSAANIIRLGGSEILKSETKAIADVDEADFGTILTLNGEITKLKSGYFYLDDGTAETRVILGKSIDKSNLQNGMNLSATGIVEKISDGWRLVPRSSADLSIEDSLSSAPATTTSSTTKVAVGTGGGLTLLGLAWAARKWMIK